VVEREEEINSSISKRNIEFFYIKTEVLKVVLCLLMLLLASFSREITQLIASYATE